MYGELGLIVRRRGGPFCGSLAKGSELTVSMSAATAWPVHDWPFCLRTLPARPSRTGGNTWSFGRYWRSRASNGSGSAFVVIVLPPNWNSDGTLVLTTWLPSRALRRRPAWRLFGRGEGRRRASRRYRGTGALGDPELRAVRLQPIRQFRRVAQRDHVAAVDL